MKRTGSVSARFSAAHRALTTVAVTGTNGKTTTVSMIEAIVAANDEPSARLTTLGAWVQGHKIVAPNSQAEFLSCVEGSAACGVKTLALETTSKALAGGLARRWPPRVAVFTNLSRDHLDMHGSGEAYLAAKAQLFVALPPGGTAVLNADDPSSALLAEVMPAHARIVRFSARGSADLSATEVNVSPDGTHLVLGDSPLARRLGGQLRVGAPGHVHAYNALAAALAMDALRYPAGAIRDGLAGFAGVVGRFEILRRTPMVVVDYAHTPDGLRGTLQSARQLTGGKLICVFGCGGGRDRGKRPQMGALAHDLADIVVLTSDNPRHEEPDAIADAIHAGAQGDGATWHRVLDRRAAIAHAASLAKSEDVVVIAGKGHEAVQEIADQSLPFDDAQVAREIFEVAPPQAQDC